MTAGRDVELELAASYGIVAGMDEVGRGAIAGPVAVGVALVDTTVGDPPDGLTDSKAMTPKRRATILPQINNWVLESAVGLASPQEIDTWGIVVALRLAGMRALEQVNCVGSVPGIVLLDGSHDWLTRPDDLMSDLEAGPLLPSIDVPPVVTRVKADLNCAVVSAASVIAKQHRDSIMSSLDDPGYEWARNKGYSSQAHIRALGRLGVSDQHRKSWRLPIPSGVPQGHESTQRG